MKPRCASCKKPIPRSEPDLIVRRMDPDDPMRTALRLVYHVRCQGAALKRAAANAGALAHDVSPRRSGGELVKSGIRSPAEPLEWRQRSYEIHKQRILAGLPEAQREMGARDRWPLGRLTDAPILLLHDGSFVAASQEANSVDRKLDNAMAYGLMRPPELSGMPVGCTAA